jgi:ribonuclease P protein component
VLARTNRLVTADDFRSVLRRGRRIPGANLVVSVVATGRPARFGFVITRKVGNSVNRNRVRRRLRAIARELVDGGLSGRDVVVRALPASVVAGWSELHAELTGAVSKTLEGGSR